MNTELLLYKKERTWTQHLFCSSSLNYLEHNYQTKEEETYQMKKKNVPFGTIFAVICNAKNI